MVFAYNQPSVVSEGEDAKLKAMLCFFIDKGGESLGKTKLMKLLYFADFGFYRDRGIAISGTEYSKWPQGPVPRRALDLLGQLTRANIIDRRDQDYGGPVRQTHVIAQAECAEDLMNALDEDERAYLEGVWEKWGSVSTSSIVEASHGEAPWLAAPLWGNIPYHTALLG